MKWICFALLVGLTGCQDKASAPAASSAATGSAAASGPGGPSEPAYKADIENLCDVLVRSNAADLDINDRTYVVATWLSQNLKTDASRKFLAQIQPLGGEQKAKALEAEAKRVGLTSCALADEWRRPRLPGVTN